MLRVHRVPTTEKARLRRAVRGRSPGLGFATSRRISEGPWPLLLGVLLGLSACEPPVAEQPDYLGMNLHGDRIDLSWDGDESTWTAFNRDLDLQSEGSFAAPPESALEGFVESEGDLGMAWAVERPGWGLVSTFPTGRGDGSLTWAVSTAVEVADYVPLLAGNHTCLRMREDGSPTDDIGFLTLDEDRFALSLLDSCTTRPENLPFGASTVEAGEGDEEGTWSLGGTNDQEIRLEGDAGTWEGVVFPGYAMALRPHSLEGLLLCLWSPLPNTQLSVYDGDFRFVEYRRGGEEPFGVPGLGTVDVFGEAGELYRRSAAGEEETSSLALRTQVYYVGNLVLWEITEDERIYMGVAGDFYMQWTQQGGPGGPNALDGDMLSFAAGFHPRVSHLD